MVAKNYTAARKARRFAMQGLYEWQISHKPIHEIQAYTRAENAMHKVDLPYYEQLMTQIAQRTGEIDALFGNFVDRQLHGGVELAILRIGTYELKFNVAIPYKIVLDEAIELAKEFGASDSHKYINGVLDKVAQQTRSSEIQHNNR